MDGRLQSMSVWMSSICKCGNDDQQCRNLDNYITSSTETPSLLSDKNINTPRFIPFCRFYPFSTQQKHCYCRPLTDNLSKKMNLISVGNMMKTSLKILCLTVHIVIHSPGIPFILPSPHVVVYERKTVRIVSLTPWHILYDMMILIGLSFCDDQGSHPKEMTMTAILIARLTTPCSRLSSRSIKKKKDKNAGNSFVVVGTAEIILPWQT